MIGEDKQQGSPRSVNNFYLNVNSPASCQGNVTGFNYSFYAPLTSPSSTDTYVLVFAVYRQTGVLNNMPTFRVVSDSYIATQPRSRFQNGRIFFSSYLPLNSPLPVEAGDVLGACVNDPRSEAVYRLDIVGTTSSPTDELMVTSASECTAQQVILSLMTLNRQMGVVLHLHANIGKTITKVTVCQIT